MISILRDLNWISVAEFGISTHQSINTMSGVSIFPKGYRYWGIFQNIEYNFSIDTLGSIDTEEDSAQSIGRHRCFVTWVSTKILKKAKMDMSSIMLSDPEVLRFQLRSSSPDLDSRLIHLFRCNTSEAERFQLIRYCSPSFGKDATIKCLKGVLCKATIVERGQKVDVADCLILLQSWACQEGTNFGSQVKLMTVMMRSNTLSTPSPYFEGGSQSEVMFSTPSVQQTNEDKDEDDQGERPRELDESRVIIIQSFLAVENVEASFRLGRGRSAVNKFRMSLGLPVAVTVNCADNTGAKNVYIISVKGIKGRLNRLPSACVGDMVMGTVKKGKPDLRKKVLPAVIVRQRKPWRRKDVGEMWIEIRDLSTYSVRSRSEASEMQMFILSLGLRSSKNCGCYWYGIAEDRFFSLKGVTILSRTETLLSFDASYEQHNYLIPGIFPVDLIPDGSHVSTSNLQWLIQLLAWKIKCVHRCRCIELLTLASALFELLYLSPTYSKMSTLCISFLEHSSAPFGPYNAGVIVNPKGETGPIGKESADLWPRIVSAANAVV
ncbi:60S ribosomal protein L23 [Hibiscus syriacus]|uniref:60S ribosomal protein L23 n=1 Tax=Hibiscus syriacus TaxID=106335 RepID=A0A6A3A079_HIBSY|nr:60S ribosomal protein L23 [Hibiscus syriacus]